MPSKARIRVYLADDHPMFLRGIVQEVKLRPELELVGQATDGRQALADIQSLQPDVALIDMRIPGLTGLEVLAAAKRDALETRVVFLSAHLDGDLVYRAIASGAAGYLSKEADRDEILDAVTAVSRGQVVLAPEGQTGLAGEVRRREVIERPILTPREREVLVMTADGLTAPEIAQRLQLGVATVRSHLQNLYEKLEVSDRAAAVAEAMRAGLLE
ncbi:MAG TPA: response regulator transcription factor [Thermoleophilaceae bacterium]|nr:response regulator transcription factor [Thermoleophilaceae bacterium]